MTKQAVEVILAVTKARNFSFEGTQHPHELTTCAYYYSQHVGGPAGELPIRGVCLSVPQVTAQRMLDLRNQIRLCEPRLNFSISYDVSKLGITYELEDVDNVALEKGPSALVLWDEPDISRKSAIGVDTSEIIFTPEGDIWFQIITEGPNVAQVPLDSVLFEQIARGRPTPRKKREKSWSNCC